MKFLDKIKGKTPRKNKVIGQVVTVLGAVSLAIAESGIIDNRPLIKIGLEVLSVKLGAVAVYNAQKVEDGSIDVK
jgi:hypothetical protein